MRKTILAFALLACALPTLTTALTCPSLYRNLTLGMSGSDVKQLQVFLIETRDLAAGNTTGYFGPLTRAAVRSFQCREMSICSGSEATNGYGKVGPMTRQAIQRVCSGTALPSQPSPTSPQNAPTCTMSVNPSSLAFGSSALLSWYSTNASSGFISPIGAVQPNGSQTVSPQQTTTYFGTFWNANNTSSQCQTTLTVAAPGQTCEHANPPTGCYWQSGATCAQDQLICPNTNQASCTLDGVTIQHGQIRKFYSQREAASASLCQTYSIDRTCTNGVLSGSTSYQYANCTVTGATCTPEQPQTQTLSCPAGQTGSITQTRTSTCPGPTWGAWTTTSNTCTTNTTEPSITITAPTQGQTIPLQQEFNIVWTKNDPTGTATHVKVYVKYPAGNEFTLATVPISTNSVSYTFGGLGATGLHEFKVVMINAQGTELARSTVGVYAQSGGGGQPSVSITAPQNGTSVARGSSLYTSWTTQNMTGNNQALLEFLQPGQAVGSGGCGAGALPAGQTSYNVNIPSTMPLGQHRLVVYYCYFLPGQANEQLASAEVLINVTGPAAGAQNQTQLANALSALESALRSLLKLLGQ